MPDKRHNKEKESGMHMRTIIIGDIHGCYKEFITLLRKIKYKKNQDRLILLGDLMDRGPFSYEMLHWAIKWKKENSERFFLIRGNHEQMILEQSKELETRLIWRAVGKTATIRSFAKNKDRIEKRKLKHKSSLNKRINSAFK